MTQKTEKKTWKKTGKVFTKILAVIGWIVVIIILAVFLSTNGVKKAANEVLDEIHQWQLETVYQNSALANEMNYEDFSKNMWVGTPMSIENAQLKSRNGRGFENNEKYIYGTFTFADGSEQTLTFRFQKVDDKYVLLGITGGTPE